VLPLPDEGRPADFSGAVGKFAISADLSQDKAGEGDPVTLRMRVTGEGDFDRVSSSMLHDADGWKTYTPTVNFKPEDEIGYRGEKLFEQPLISLQPGTREVPEVHFSWFDPATRRYEQAHTEPLSVAITPAPAGGPLTSGPVSASSGAASNPAGTQAGQPWRPDHPDDGSGPHRDPDAALLSAGISRVAALVLIALSTAWFWLRREEHQTRAVRVEPFMLPSVESLGTEMDQHAAAGDVQSFFGAARRALCAALASKWDSPCRK